MLNWYALHSKPHRELQVQRILGERGIEVYLPAVTPTPCRGKSTRAFFPCYLFAHTDLDVVGLWGLHYAPGLRGVIMTGDTPVRVDARVIGLLRERLERTDAVDARGEIMEPGDRVEIRSGPLADWQGVFDQRLSASGRVRVLVQLLQRWTPVEVGAKELRRTGGATLPDSVRAVRN